MNAHELYDAIQSRTPDGREWVLFELFSVVQTLSTAVLELAGERKLSTGVDPLTMRSRTILSDFIELVEKEERNRT